MSALLLPQKLKLHHRLLQLFPGQDYFYSGKIRKSDAENGSVVLSLTKLPAPAFNINVVHYKDLFDGVLPHDGLMVFVDECETPRDRVKRYMFFQGNYPDHRGTVLEGTMNQVYANLFGTAIKSLRNYKGGLPTDLLDADLIDAMGPFGGHVAILDAMHLKRWDNYYLVISSLPAAADDEA